MLSKKIKILQVQETCSVRGVSFRHLEDFNFFYNSLASVFGKYRSDFQTLLTLSFAFSCVGCLASLNEPEIIDMALNEYKNATNMTDQVAALAAICQNPGDARSKTLADFYEQWKEETLVCLVRNVKNLFIEQKFN